MHSILYTITNFPQTITVLYTQYTHREEEKERQITIRKTATEIFRWNIELREFNCERIQFSSNFSLCTACASTITVNMTVNKNKNKKNRRRNTTWDIESGGWN